jgi:uncharacterized membrane protein YfcA
MLRAHIMLNLDILLAAPLAFLVGISLGLLGGGGSILAVPIFVYVLHVAPKSAIVSSLLVVGLTSLVGALRHAQDGHVQVRTGTLFGGAGLVGASLGSRLAAHPSVPGNLLLVVFALLMVTVAILLLRNGTRPPRSAPPAGRRHMAALGIYGLATGFLTGLLGAGGGFIIVPVLMLAGGLPMHHAIGTSLLVITLNCGAGLLGFLGKVPIHWLLAATFALASTLGSLVGARMATHTRPDRLRRGFAVFILVAGVAIFVERMVEQRGF